LTSAYPLVYASAMNTKAQLNDFPLIARMTLELACCQGFFQGLMEGDPKSHLNPLCEERLKAIQRIFDELRPLERP
jgi:hypothetical protein